MKWEEVFSRNYFLQAFSKVRGRYKIYKLKSFDVKLVIKHSKEIVFWKEKWIFNLKVPTGQTTSTEPWKNEWGKEWVYNIRKADKKNLEFEFPH